LIKLVIMLTCTRKSFIFYFG